MFVSKVGLVGLVYSEMTNVPRPVYFDWTGWYRAGFPFFQGDMTDVNAKNPPPLILIGGNHRPINNVCHLNLRTRGINPIPEAKSVPLHIFQNFMTEPTMTSRRISKALLPTLPILDVLSLRTCLGRSCGASIKTGVTQTLVTVCNQTHTGEHPVTMRCRVAAPRTPPAAPAPACSTPSAPTTPTAVPSTDSIPDPPALPAPDPSQLLADNPALNQKIHDIQQQMKVILDHSIESDQRLLEFTDQVFVARSAVNVPSSPHQSRDQYCQTSDNYQHPCERCSIFKEEVQNMLTTIKTLEEEIKVLKTEKLSLIDKTNCTCTQHTNSIPLSNNKYEILSHLQDKPDDFTIVTKKKKKQKPNKKKKNNHFLKTHKTKIENGWEKIKKTPLQDGVHRGRQAMVDGDTDVSGICKPGAGLLNTTPDPAPPPGNCFVLVSGNNDVAAGRQNIIFGNLVEVIKNCRMTSKVLITPLFPRYDLPPDSPIQKNIRLANAYISELCVRREGVEMVDISRIGRQFFTAHGQHLRASGKRLLAGLMAEHLASMTSKPHCPRPTAPSNTGGAPDPSRRGTPGLPPCDPRRASPGTSATMATSSAGASAPAVVGRESTDGRLLQRVTYAEAVGGYNGGEASPDGTCFLGAPPAAVGVN
ncbi:hypothetical protein J6590_066359 [Homalodisca vitripennis]|nr:hypothetical protein J6590_066359 [Homalodisca vitripennis]